ncbi:DUF5686 and carboxypeptidase regulatory-like domain-containing protein [Foetidibacter luteolus]|uniref:DUF5686 and carboxypeptidase regulatory-like domain-containing protein n=1 Tax=Foetidibacter luteolus TaxID=2608880 RepID=UPI00129AD617|nr:DUF5686 and carboxypeptidase regulatory-like domain-containing protein [Foetidibacter luteolus]
MKANTCQCILLLLLIIPGSFYAQKISGTVTGTDNKPLGFSSVTIKGTGVGVSANAQGTYEITVKPGTYRLLCQRIGYRTAEKEVQVTGNTRVDFVLEIQQYQLNDVVVKSGGEDPAYAIIRQAIKKRPDYEHELKKFTCKVYIKGQLRLRDFPKKFLGKEVDFEDGDTSKKKILFLSESFSTYAVNGDQQKVEVLSTKVSGSSDGYGFATPQIISFYQNNVRVGRNLNPRGFVSPIADNALNFYRYKLEGTYFEDNRMINRIKVTARRKYEPVFNGYINIIENEWRIASVELSVDKEQQMQFLDTLKIEQLYAPYQGTWLLQQQVVYPSVKFFGFDAYGSFVQVHKDFNLQPEFEQGYFNDIVVDYKDSSNKKPPAYWDSIRPLPLQQDEAADYIKKDSLEKLKQNPAYLDSLDRKRNKLTIAGILLTGQSYSREKDKLNISFPSVVNMLNYNTVEGAVINFSPALNKTFADIGKTFSVSPTLRYGFSNRHFNMHFKSSYQYGKKARQSVSISGGKQVLQFNNLQPITEVVNSISTLFYERNYMKLYEAWFGKLQYSKELGKGFNATIAAEYQDRLPLENTSSYSWKDYSDRAFTPNYPQAAGAPMPRNQAVTASVLLRWVPGTKYIRLPEATFGIGSKYPTLELYYKQAFNNVLGSDVQYSRWNFSIYDALNMKLAGRIDYRFSAGGIFNSRQVFLPDYQHYADNETAIASVYLNSFQLMPYYTYSNTSTFQSSAHIEYHLNGLLSNKIPLLKQWNWYFIIGGNALHVDSSRKYAEVFFSIENILKVIRVDFVQAFQTGNKPGFGIRLGIPGFLTGGRGNQ